MEKGNVLVIGNSGVGKSTLINAVLGEEKAKVGWGTDGTTDNLNIYENEALPFRIIDTVGFEPSFIKNTKLLMLLRNGRKTVRKKDMKILKLMLFGIVLMEHQENYFRSNQRPFKSYCYVEISTCNRCNHQVILIPDRKENIEMVEQAFANQKLCRKIT